MKELHLLRDQSLFITLGGWKGRDHMIFKGELRVDHLWPTEYKGGEGGTLKKLTAN